MSCLVMYWEIFPQIVVCNWFLTGFFLTGFSSSFSCSLRTGPANDGGATIFGWVDKKSTTPSFSSGFRNLFKIRFKVLFDKRKKWPGDELSAFIRDVCSNDFTEINNALAKYCRPFNQNGVKYFSSRL